MQISDLHIKRCADWEIMKKSYIKAIPKENIDFIIVTGDLHNHDEEYSETENFLNEIKEATTLDKSDFFIIPGNHDSKDFKYKDALINDILSNIDKDSEYYKKYKVELKDAFQKYIEFYKKQFELDMYELENVHLMTWKDKLNIIEINTALISDGNNSHKQIIDILDLTRLSIGNDLPTIAIGHHEISYFFEEHQNIFKRVLTDLNVAAYLCGDLHKNATNIVTNYSSSNKVIPCIVCGKSAIDNKDVYSDNSFIIYEYDERSSNTNIVVTLHKWDPKKKNFYKANDFDTDEGAFEFQL